MKEQLSQNKILEKPFYSGDDIAEILGISRSKAFSLMKNGEIPILQIGRNIRVSRSDFDQYINDHTNHKGATEIKNSPRERREMITPAGKEFIDE